MLFINYLNRAFNQSTDVIQLSNLMRADIAVGRLTEEEMSFIISIHTTINTK